MKYDATFFACSYNHQEPKIFLVLLPLLYLKILGVYYQRWTKILQLNVNGLKKVQNKNVRNYLCKFSNFKCGLPHSFDFVGKYNKTNKIISNFLFLLLFFFAKLSNKPLLNPLNSKPTALVFLSFFLPKFTEI